MQDRADLETKWRIFLTGVFSAVYGQHPKLGRELLDVEVAEAEIAAALTAGHGGWSRRRSGLADVGLIGTAMDIAVQRSSRVVPRFKGGRPGTTTARLAGHNEREDKMFGTMKKAMVAGAVVATAALAGPAMASADHWFVDAGGGLPAIDPYEGPAHAQGQLTLTLAATGTTTTCDVTAGMDLSNPGGVAHGQVTSFLLSDCTTNAPGCTVSAVANTTNPWTVATAGTSVTISGIEFTNTYGGGSGCALNGASVTATGSITGSASAGSNAIVFTNAPGLSTPFGAATVSGSVNATLDDGRQVTLHDVAH